MRIKQKYIHRVRLRIGEIYFAENLKRLRGGLAGVGREAVSYFQAVLVRLMLDVTAEGAIDGAGDKTEDGEQEQERWKRGPIVQVANSPSGAPARENPANRPKAEVKKNKERHEGEGQTFPDVVENVVTHFVS